MLVWFVKAVKKRLCNEITFWFWSLPSAATILNEITCVSFIEKNDKIDYNIRLNKSLIVYAGCPTNKFMPTSKILFLEDQLFISWYVKIKIWFYIIRHHVNQDINFFVRHRSEKTHI